MNDFPESVEEAGALLGATITRCSGKETFQLEAPPKGMHSAFATIQPVPSSELLTRLHALRAFLRSAPQNEPLVAAPSLLAVLMKLLGVSTSLATASPSASTANAADGSHRVDTTPPMMSTPLRMLWVDCVTLCHRLGEGLSGTAKINTTQFIRKMLELAGMNPRSARAAGGVRIAALDVIASLFRDPKLVSQLAPWSLEVLQLCLRALRSAGNGEPTYRVSAMRTACATAVACRQASLKTRPVDGKAALVLQGAMEDKAIVESVRVLRLAATDKFPEVRSEAATFAALLAPLLVHASGGQDHSATSSLEDVMTLALKNIDEESPFVSDGWAEALSRCVSTAIQFNEQLAMGSRLGRRDGDEGDGGGSPPQAEGTAEATARFGSRKHVGMAHTCSNLPNAVKMLVAQFVKAGGEVSASRAGGSFSSGGRAVRVGLSLALVKLLRLQSELGSIGEDSSISMKATIGLLLNMLGDRMEKQLKPPAKADTGNPGGPLFGRNWSKADPSLARLAVCRGLREGLSEVATEPIQLAILHELVAMVLSLDQTSGDSATSPPVLNANQLQVVLIEISHLISTLGEAATSAVEDTVSCLTICLSNQDHGVRYEAAIACEAIAMAFPSVGRQLLLTLLEEIQFHHAELVTLASVSSEDKAEEHSSGIRMFRRGHADQHNDKSLPHQYAIHGRTLVVSILIRDMPRLPGGITMSAIDTALSVAEILVSFQFNETLTASNPGAVCHCVRAGFSVISGVLATGPKGATPDISLIFGAWQKSCNSAKVGGKNFAPRHDLFCLDAVLSSIVVFLKYCSELLLSIPEALSHVTMILEESLQLFLPQGRFNIMSLTFPVVSRLQSAKASLLEAFAWLPSGSFPMAADTVFGFAAQHIREAVEKEVTCSILHTLVNKEDSLLDSKTTSRAKREGQLGGAKEMEETIASLTAEAVLHGEREAVIHLLSWEEVDALNEESHRFLDSTILGAFCSDNSVSKPPTPLHEVGSWRRPFDPSCSSKIRLVDAAIQAFSATFGLKSGKEQQSAMDMLESLVPPLLAQLARAMGVNAALTEQDRRSKAKEDSAAVANITAVILSCLQSLPLHEATHNVPIALGPQWMNKAKDLLLTLLPSASTIVRRGAAEALALLATLGVSEDAHFLQSSVLHSLDEVMQGNKPDGKPRAIALEPVSAARSGSLLTLACIQRTACKVAQRQLSRARERASTGGSEKATRRRDDELPILQMMTRILPSASFYGAFRDYFIVRTYALHSFAVLLSYSGRLDGSTLDDVDMQLLKKGVELIEGNFVAAWTVASHDVDRGQEPEKMASEVAFLSVLLRLMTFVVPFLHHLQPKKSEISHCFATMATLILESHSSHPVVSIEAMAFFEVLAAHRQLLPPPSTHVNYDENPLLSCIPFIMDSTLRPTLFASGPRKHDSLVCARSLRAAVRVAEALTLSHINIVRLSDMKTVSLLVAALEVSCGSRYFTGSTFLRSLAASHELELSFGEVVALEREIFGTVREILVLERSFSGEATDPYLRWILFARAILSGAAAALETDADDLDTYNRSSVVRAATLRATNDTSPVYAASNPPRWQVKTLTAQLASGGLDGIVQSCHERGVELKENPNFDFKLASRSCAARCREAEQTRGAVPPSELVFHLEDILSAACMSSVATLDHAELRTLQGSAVLFLARLIVCFSQIPDPEHSEVSILDQYTTQIFSSVKHALGSMEEADEEDSGRLFLAGCETLQQVIETELTSDPMVLKRLIRPAVPADNLVPFFRRQSGYPMERLKSDESKMYGNTRLSPLVKVCQLWTCAKLFSGHSGDGVRLNLNTISTELINNEIGVGVHCAAVGIDGARLLLGANLSLAGLLLSDDDERKTLNLEAGFLFQNIDDISDAVKAVLARAWSACSSYAVMPLVAEIASEQADEEKREACLDWVTSLLPFLISGFHDADEAMRAGANEPVPEWASGLDASSVMIDCLRGIGSLVEGCPDSCFDATWNDQIATVVDRVKSSIVMPVLGTSDSGESQSNSKEGVEDTMTFEPSTALVSEVCDILCQLAASKSASSRKDSAVLITLLTPLDMLQKEEIDFTRKHSEDIITTCLTGIGKVIDQGNAPDTLVRSMVQLVLKNVLGSEKPRPAKVKEAAKELLQYSLSQAAIDGKEQNRIARELARNGNWEGWAVVSLVDNGAAIAKSLEQVGQSLFDSANADSQLDLLATLRSLVQSASIPSPLVGVLFHGVGAEVLGVLLQYGTLHIPLEAHEHRKTACADSMKILLIAYQQIISEGTDEDVSAFLSILFETLLAILRFNGLPNHPSPNAGGDVTLGRMAAQAILNIARTTPVAFKATVTNLSEHDRTLLEFTVRAEMTEYAVPSQQAPVKKKLDLKSFKK